MTTFSECPLCNSHSITRVMECIDHYATGEAFELYQCAKCGFRFTQQFPAETEIGRYYETPDYISHSDTKKGVVNKLYHHVRSYMLKQKAKIVEQYALTPQGRVLDIGTGTGYFITTMQQRGWQISAIEKSPDARAYAQKQWGIEVQPDGTMEQLDSNSFDAITLWHVLEHIEPLKETCHHLNRLLKPEGVLVVALPNCSSFDADKYQAVWAAYDVPRHLWHFTPQTFAKLAQEAGFEIEAIKPMPFDAFYVSMLSEKYNKQRYSMIRGCYTGLCGWYKSWHNPTKSSSIIYILKKTNNPHER